MGGTMIHTIAVHIQTYTWTSRLGDNNSATSHSMDEHQNGLTS